MFKAGSRRRLRLERTESWQQKKAKASKMHKAGIRRKLRLKKWEKQIVQIWKER